MRLFRRPKEKNGHSRATDFMWGVPRREGHSDTDDPLAHAGVVQHAFEFGRDDRAICGYEPPKRTSRAYRDPRPQLALAGRDNPRCRKCELLIASLASEEEATDPGADADVIVAVPDNTGARVAGAEEAPQSGEVPVMMAEQGNADATSAPDDGEAAETDQRGDGARDADGARAPGFHPRATIGQGGDSEEVETEADQRGRARRRSVRRAGNVIVGAGKRSVVVDVPTSPDIAGIVANVEEEIDDLRVSAVTVGNDGTARITLNRPTPEPILVTWYIVSAPGRESA